MFKDSFFLKKYGELYLKLKGDLHYYRLQHGYLYNIKGGGVINNRHRDYDIEIIYYPFIRFNGMKKIDKWHVPWHIKIDYFSSNYKKNYTGHSYYITRHGRI